MRGNVRSTVLLVTFLLLFPVLPALAQTPPEKAPPRLFGAFAPKLGVWSEYQVTAVPGGGKSSLRMSIVGQEGDSWWYEVVLAEGGTRNIIKMFVKGDPNNPENIQRLIMKSGDEPARERPRDFVALGRKMAAHQFEALSGAPATGQEGIKVEEVGARELTVPAGKFATVQHRILDAAGKVLGSYDVNKEILPFGVVASETEKARLELVAYGKDAKTQITEQPVMMQGPPGMPEGMPRGRPPGMEMPAGGPPAPATGGYGK